MEIKEKIQNAKKSLLAYGRTYRKRSQRRCRISTTINGR